MPITDHEKVILEFAKEKLRHPTKNTKTGKSAEPNVVSPELLLLIEEDNIGMLLDLYNSKL